ncbi:putative integral membrane protein Pth11-like protein, partial [Rhizodiscina lignyota]
MLLPRGIYSDIPPAARTKDEDIPTLLYSWWCSMFALVIILVRLGGRLVRNDMLFREDKIMAFSILPLLARMALIHVVLIWGTNNALVSSTASATELHNRSIGSRLVLGARIFYAMYIWIAKFTVLEFLKRLTESRFWKKSFERGMRFIKYYLVLTFCAVLIATIAECHPITHYWQVVPDPGPQCRQAFAQLITMGVADMTTDLLIVGFPIPVILASAMPVKRKVNLTLLFSLSVLLIVITAYRVPAVIAHKGRQQYRTVWASSEILAAAAVSNAVVLGSFVRDRGLKKAKKYKFGSITDSMDKSSTRRPTIANRHWGSDEDLVADMGYRLDPELQCHRVSEPRPAGPVNPLPNSMHKREDSDMTPINTRDWQFP